MYLLYFVFNIGIDAQMKLYNRNFAVGERLEYMGWVNEGVINSNISWQTYKPRFLVLKGTEVMLFDSPPVSIIIFRMRIERKKKFLTNISLKNHKCKT